MLVLKINKIAMLTALTAVIISGCGKQEFKKVDFQSTANAAGDRVLPSKVDIVLVADNTGSMNSSLAMVESQMASFTSSLRSHAWDYRVAKVLIEQPTAITSVLVNPDYNSATLPDGTPNPNTDLVPAANAITDISQFLPLVSSGVLYNNNGMDITYQNTFTMVKNATKFPVIGPSDPVDSPLRNATLASTTAVKVLRADALLAVIVVTNGAEYDVDPLGNGSVNSSRLSYWSSQLKTVRSDTRLVRFYPIAAASWNNTSSCLGGNSKIGVSYSRMITDNLLPGKSYNLCDSTSLASVLSSIDNDLSQIRQNFVRSFIVLPHEPIVSSIRVYKNGAQLLPSSTNGWTYDGGPKTVLTITGIVGSNGQVTPYFADAQTGWVIKLNGSAQLYGGDTPRVEYQRP